LNILNISLRKFCSAHYIVKMHKFGLCVGFRGTFKILARKHIKKYDTKHMDGARFTQHCRSGVGECHLGIQNEQRT